MKKIKKPRGQLQLVNQTSYDVIVSSFEPQRDVEEVLNLG